MGARGRLVVHVSAYGRLALAGVQTLKDVFKRRLVIVKDVETRFKRIQASKDKLNGLKVYMFAPTPRGGAAAVHASLSL